MPHHHDHAGHTHRSNNTRRMAMTLVLTAIYMVAEAVGGWLSGSLALVADAGHMLSDVAALGLSLFALWIARRPATPQHTYGYYRAEILAALANGATLVAISILVFIEAFKRIGSPPEVEGSLMMGIAAGGLVVNLIGLSILHSGRGESLNVHGAWLHLLTDALGSVAALVAGGLIALYGWDWVDPVASIAIGLLVIYSAWGLLKEAIAILMERTPGHLDIDQVQNTLAQTPGVCGVHDLHIWTITSGMVSLSAHVVLSEGHSAAEALESMRLALHEQFGIDHMTVQIEPPGDDHCEAAF